MGTFVRDEKGTIVCHRVWFKVLLNPILRKIQFWTDQPYVITSCVEDERVVGYQIKRVRLLR